MWVNGTNVECDGILELPSQLPYAMYLIEIQYLFSVLLPEFKWLFLQSIWILSNDKRTTELMFSKYLGYVLNILVT